MIAKFELRRMMYQLRWVDDQNQPHERLFTDRDAVEAFLATDILTTVQKVMATLHLGPYGPVRGNS